jgi:phospholipid/cholesterol/gamma-HCH transport system ATP-binding protein
VALLDDGRMHFEGTPAEFVACADEPVRAFRESVGDLRAEITACRLSKRPSTASSP